MMYLLSQKNWRILFMAARSLPPDAQEQSSAQNAVTTSATINVFLNFNDDSFFNGLYI